MNIIEECALLPVDNAECLNEFSCGNKDLDEFFSKDSFPFSKQLLGKTYYFQKIEASDINIIGAFTVSNDSLKANLITKPTRNRIQRGIPNSKRTRSYPAVLIGRLGVSNKCQCQSVGKQILDYIKTWFSHPDNKSGCRFVVVDAYNNENTIHFYIENGFRFLYEDEKSEKKTYFISESESLTTRLMYFDLISFVQS